MLHSDKQDAFRIEFVLGSPVAASPNPLYIDALIGAVNFGTHHLALNNGAIMGSKVFYVNCFNIEGGMTSQRRGFTRKPPSEKCASEYHRDEGLLRTGKRIGSMTHKPSLGSGKLKAYGGEGTYITANWYSHAVAWCVGDKEAVSNIINQVTHIGSKTRLGYGAVLAVSVIDDENAKKHWSKRVLPAGHVLAENEDYAKSIETVRGPYWDKQNREIVAVFSGKCPEFTPSVQCEY